MKFIKNILPFFLLSVFIFPLQHSYAQKNTIKADLWSGIAYNLWSDMPYKFVLQFDNKETDLKYFRFLKFGYERNMKKKFAAGLMLNSWWLDESKDSGSITRNTRGMGFILETRYYLFHKDSLKTPSGFFCGANLRYERIVSKLNFSSLTYLNFTGFGLSFANSGPVEYVWTGTVYGIGAFAGYKFIFFKRISLEALTGVALIYADVTPDTKLQMNNDDVIVKSFEGYFKSIYKLRFEINIGFAF